MDPRRDASSISHTAAAARLRLAADVRRRARRGVLVPPTALVVLGVVIAGRGAIMLAWPHPDVPWIAWIAIFVAARIALGARRRQRGLSRGVTPSTRLRATHAAAGLIAVAVAIVTGASALILGAAAVTATAAYLAGLPALALAAVLTGAVSEGLVLEGAHPGIGLIVFGIGLAAIGVSARAPGVHAL